MTLFCFSKLFCSCQVIRRNLFANAMDSTNLLGLTKWLIAGLRLCCIRVAHVIITRKKKINLKYGILKLFCYGKFVTHVYNQACRSRIIWDWWQSFDMSKKEIENTEKRIRIGLSLLGDYLMYASSTRAVLSVVSIGDFRNVFKFHAFSVNKRFLTTAKLVRGLSERSNN